MGQIDLVFYTSGGYQCDYSVLGAVDEREEYRLDPRGAVDIINQMMKNNKTATWTPNLVTYSAYTSGQRLACYVQATTTEGHTSQVVRTFNTNIFDFKGTFVDENGSTSTKAFDFFPIEWWTDPDSETCGATVNIPIFATLQEAENYVNAVTDEEALLLLEDALNYFEEEREEQFYEFGTRYRTYSMDEYGNLTDLGNEGYRGFRIKTKGYVSLYKIPGINDGALKYGINITGSPIICYYSYDGQTWQNVPGQPTTLPFNFIYRPYEEGDGTGTFIAAVGNGDNKNLFIFDNEEDSNEYNSGGSDGRKASNYSEIMSGNFDNPTGDEDEETEFGEVKTRGFFSQQYIMDSTCLQALANDLFDTTAGGIWEDIKKGLDMYGDNPMDAVMGLSFWPVDLTQIFSGVAATHIWFGGYGWEPKTGTALRLTYPNGYKSLGSLAIRRTFNNWRDFAPYTRLFVSLPYCGKYELDLTRYYGKTVEVRYFFDTRTNGCIACLIADSHLMDYYNGQCGVTMPITLTDFSSYSNSQIQTLLGFGGQAVNTGMNSLAGAPQVAAAGTGAAALGLAGVGVAGAAIGAKAVYGLTQNNINKFNTTKGSSSSMINEYLPQYVEFTFEIQEDCAPDNYGQQYGYPSMMSGTVGSFQGFLKCQSVKLNCGVATEQEKNSIKTMLLNGIYI